MEKKSLKVRPDRTMPRQYEVYYEGGGQVPDVLLGKYSSVRSANQHIDRYINRVKPSSIKYKGQMEITKEEEAILFEKVKSEVKLKNQKKEEDLNGKAKVTKKSNSSRAKHVRKRTDNGG